MWELRVHERRGSFDTSSYAYIMDLKLRHCALLATVLPLQSLHSVGYSLTSPIALTVRYNRKIIFSRLHISLVLPVFHKGPFLDRYFFHSVFHLSVVSYPISVLYHYYADDTVLYTALYLKTFSLVSIV